MFITLITEYNPAPKLSKSRPVVFLDVEYESSDSAVDELQQPSSDSEPEDVGFKESKQKTLGQVKLAVQQIRTEKERKKLKRKERDDLYRRQKVSFAQLFSLRKKI